MSPLLTTVMGVVAVTALALDYMRERRLEENTVARIDGEISQLRHDLHGHASALRQELYDQTRRIDAAFVQIRQKGPPE